MPSLVYAAISSTAPSAGHSSPTTAGCRETMKAHAHRSAGAPNRNRDSAWHGHRAVSTQRSQSLRIALFSRPPHSPLMRHFTRSHTDTGIPSSVSDSGRQLLCRLRLYSRACLDDARTSASIYDGTWPR